MPGMPKLKEMARELTAPEPMLAGTVTAQAITCGNPRCACMAKSNPRKHACHKLTWTENGRTKGVTLRKDEVGIATAMTESYRRVSRLALAAGREVAALAREHGVVKAQAMAAAAIRSASRSVPLAARPESAKLKALAASRDKWRAKALARQSRLGGDRIRIRDLATSRETWKRKAMAAGRENQRLGRALAQLRSSAAADRAGHKKKRR